MDGKTCLPLFQEPCHVSVIVVSDVLLFLGLFFSLGLYSTKHVCAEHKHRASPQKARRHVSRWYPVIGCEVCRSQDERAVSKESGRHRRPVENFKVKPGGPTGRTHREDYYGLLLLPHEHCSLNRYYCYCFSGKLIDFPGPKRAQIHRYVIVWDMSV